jgi:predicted nucleic acid-binding protein
MIPSSSAIIVVDASVFVDIVLGDERLAERIATGEIHVPVTIDVEVVHALRRRWLAGILEADSGWTAIEVFAALEMTRHPMTWMTDRIWALRQNLTAYDAGYVALAEILKAPLLTRDRRLANSSGHAATIEYID